MSAKFPRGGGGGGEQTHSQPSVYMLRDINFIYDNFELELKSALLACCLALKVPFSWKFTMSFLGAGGNTLQVCIELEKSQNNNGETNNRYLYQNN